jgi:O-antigen/teichoic acid export membrane protein
VLLSGIAAGLAKAIGMAATLLTIPVTAPYLGAERFGLFMTLSAVPLLMSFSDFGIGNGLLTELAKACGREAREDAAMLVSSAFYMLAAIGLLAAAVAAGLCSWLPWASILHVMSPPAVAEVAPALLVFALCAALNVPLGVVQRAQQGFQEAYITNLWLAAGNLVSLGLLLLFVRLGLGLPWLVGAVAGGPVVTGALNTLVEFGWRRRWLAPRPRLFRKNAARQILVTGLMIFSSQAGAAVLLSCPMFLLAHAATVSTVAPFSIIQRVFSVFVIASSMFMTPLWPAYSEAWARGDFRWVRSTFRRSLLVNGLICGLPILLLASIAPWLTGFLSKGTVRASLPLAFAAGLMSFLMSTRHTVSMMVNGCGYLRRTMITFPLAAALAVSYPLWPQVLPGEYGVPLWVCLAEGAVLSALLLDARKIVRAATVASPGAREVCV